jgi:hypothetical protein
MHSELRIHLRRIGTSCSELDGCSTIQGTVANEEYDLFGSVIRTVLILNCTAYEHNYNLTLHVSDAKKTNLSSLSGYSNNVDALESVGFDLPPFCQASKSSRFLST